MSGLSGNPALYGGSQSFKNDLSIEPNYQQQAANLQQRLHSLSKLRSCNSTQLNGHPSDGGLQISSLASNLVSSLASSISPTQSTSSPQSLQQSFLTTLNGSNLSNGGLPSNQLTPAPSPQDSQSVLDVLNCSTNAAGLGNSSNSSSSGSTNSAAVNLLNSSSSGSLTNNLSNNLTNNVMSAIAAIAAASQSTNGSPANSSQLLQEALNSLANGGHLRESSSKGKSKFVHRVLLNI